MFLSVLHKISDTSYCLKLFTVLHNPMQRNTVFCSRPRIKCEPALIKFYVKPTWTVAYFTWLFVLALIPSLAQYFIEKSEEAGLAPLGFNPNYRNNTRVVFNSPEISAWLWDRVKHVIKPIVVEPDDYKQIGEGYRLEGTWVPVGLNSHWRVCKYEVGGHFGKPCEENLLLTA